jgi:hypothetical protein
MSLFCKLFKGLKEAPPNLSPQEYTNTIEQRKSIEYGRYLVVRKDGKTHLETFNGSGWAYNHNEIRWFYLPKIS